MKFPGRTLASFLVLVGMSVFLTPGTAMAQDDHALAPGEETPDLTIKIDASPQTTFELGGAAWLRIATQNWIQASDANKRGGVYFDQFRLAVTGRHQLASEEGYLTMSAQFRWWQYMYAVHHMWMGYHFNDRHEVEVGVTQAPFGILFATSNAFWYSLGYYHGLEDDHDAGIKYRYSNGPLELHAAYFRSEEYNNAFARNRFAPDLVRSGDQDNEEQNQLNLRLAYTFGEGSDNTTEFGVSGEFGGIRNRTEGGGDGDRWQAALHYVGNYGKWNPKFQVARYEYHPDNPPGVDNRLVQMGFFEDIRLVAAEATAVSANIRRFFDVNLGPFKDFNAYLDYSGVYKDESAFADSHLINPGCVFIAGPVYVWVDFIWGKNAWWLNDSMEFSGPGEGAIRPDDWEFRFNVSLMWFF